jgi:eukaryotic-like serine/threonine-protein kinase
MQAERWRRVEQLYHAAMEQEDDQRAAFLEHSCAGDQGLRAEVDSLIVYGRQTGQIIDKPAVEVVVAAMAEDFCAQGGNNSDKMIGARTAQNGIGEKTLTSGTKLGDYEVKSLLGSGGMGEVYRARDSRLGRDVAIKVLPSFLSADSDRLRRFEQEARAAAVLNHPNILAVFQMGTYEGAPYLVSELLEGETLRDQIKHGRLSVRKAIDYGVQITHGLAAAHERGIVHRDLKPENLFVTKDGRLKILDFGLAKLTQPQPSATTPTEGTATGAVMGTVGYMSPEQVRGQTADHRADIFAFGAILYEMLAGKRAFQKPTSPQTMTAILNEDPPGISQVATNIPPALQRVVHRCLEKNPEQRFQSASDLAFALDALSDSSGYSTADVSHAQQSRGRLLGGIVVSAVAVVLVAAAFLAWRLLHSRTSDAPPIHSIAVLPFANASNNPEMDYLGEGISEEITNSLSRLPNLQVMARSVVSRDKSRKDDPQGVGHDLQVDAVLTGRVVGHGNELDVETELVNVGTGAQLWGERYTRGANDVSLLQAAITRDVTSQLRPQLAGNERDSLAKVGTKDAEAYRLYLRGRLHFEQWTGEDFKAAAEFFDRAVSRDPNYAAAYAGVADAYGIQGYFGFSSGRETFDKSRTAARRALELDSQIPESHLSLAMVDLSHFWNFAEAEAEIRQALALDPNSAYAHEVSCWFDLQMGRLQGAITECSKAVDLDPLSLLYSSMLGEAYLYTRDYNHAIEQENKTLEIDPKYLRAVFDLAYIYESMGDYKKAMEHWAENAQLEGHGTRAKELMQAFEKSGYPGYLRKDAKDNEAEGDHYTAACDYALLGEKDAAFADLEKAFATHTGLLPIKVDPELENIRSDPRYGDLLRRIGLPQ